MVSYLHDAILLTTLVDVLILIVVEDSLVLAQLELYFDWWIVLILIVVEDSLVQSVELTTRAMSRGLNPYCSGR